MLLILVCFFFFESFTVDSDANNFNSTVNNFNSTFIPLAYSEGKGNCLNFLICSMAVATGLGVCMVVFLACCCFFAYLYWKNYRIIQLFRGIKFKISDETLNGSSEEVNTEQNQAVGGARPKVITNQLVAAASGPIPPVMIPIGPQIVKKRHRDVEAGVLEDVEVFSV